MKEEPIKTIEIGEAPSTKGTNSEFKKPKKKRPQHTKANKSPIILSDANLLRQPVVLTLLNYSPSVIGNRVIITIVRKLQETFSKMIEEHEHNKTDWRQLSIFDQIDTIGDYVISPDELAFEIHMSELVSDSKRYQEAFNEVYNFSRTPVTYDYVEERDGVRLTMTTSEQLFKTIVVEEENMEHITDRNGRSVVRYKNRRPQVALVFSKSMAKRIFSFRDRYGDYLDLPAFDSSNQYFYRIYSFLSIYKYMDIPVKVVEYDTFREMLGLYKLNDPRAAYTVYKDFFRRVIEPTMEEMKRKADEGNIDIWFDMEKGTDDGRRSATPDWLRFTIHLTELGQSIKDSKKAKSDEARLSERMEHEFSQTRTQTAALLKKARGMDLGELEKKLDELADARKDGKITITRSPCSYFNKTIGAFIDKYHADHPASAPGMAEADGKSGTSDVATDETAREKEPSWTPTPREWTSFRKDCMELFGDDMFREYLQHMDFAGKDGNRLTVYMPTRALVERFEASDIFDDCFALLRKHFGPDIELYYNTPIIS